MSKKIDLTGKRFGRYLVIEEAGRDKFGHALWRCKCDCGNEVIVLGHSLIAGRSCSCGCLKREKNSELHTKHGLQLTNKRLHDAIQRHFRWIRIGSREWRGWILDARYTNDPEGAMIFCQDVITLYPDECARYEIDTSLEMDKDSDADKIFRPESLMFVTRKQNVNNRRNTLRLEDGTSLAEFCTKVGMETRNNGNPSKQYRRVSEMYRIRHKPHPELVQKANELIALYTKILKLLELRKDVRRFASAAGIPLQSTLR